MLIDHHRKNDTKLKIPKNQRNVPADRHLCIQSPQYHIASLQFFICMVILNISNYDNNCLRGGFMNSNIKKNILFSMLILSSLCLLNTSQAMDKHVPKLLPSDAITMGNRKHFDYLTSDKWHMIAPSIQIQSRIAPGKQNYRCQHFALDKILQVPSHLQFSTNDHGIPSKLVYRYFQATNYPKENDLVLYSKRDNFGHSSITHFAVFKNENQYESKLGSFPEIVVHAPKDCPAMYGNENWFWTLKDTYKSENNRNILFQDMEMKKTKYLHRLESLHQKLSVYENEMDISNCPESYKHIMREDIIEDYYPLLHDYNITLDNIHQYPLSNEQMEKVNTF